MKELTVLQHIMDTMSKYSKIVKLILIKLLTMLKQLRAKTKIGFLLYKQSKK